MSKKQVMTMKVDYLKSLSANTVEGSPRVFA